MCRSAKGLVMHVDWEPPKVRASLAYTEAPESTPFVPDLPTVDPRSLA